MMVKTAIFLLWILAFKAVLCKRQSGEFRLRKVLMENYNPEVRPVINDSDIVKLDFEIALQQIVEVNEKGESLAISAFFRQFWHDPNLRWNPIDYDNVTTTNFSPESIWKPDVALYNNVEKDVEFGGQLDLLKNRIIVSYNGSVTWFSLGIINGKCPMNIRYFPFDTQICKFKFGAWTYHGFLVDINARKYKVDVKSYTNHSEWHLHDAIQVKNVKYYGCCPEPYPDVTVEISLQRRPLFYVLNLLLPMILIGFLTLLSFYLPAQSGERVSFAVTLLLAMTVFMLLVADMVPASSESVPLLGVFFTAVMVEMVLMVFVMCYVLKLHLIEPENGEEISPFMRKFVYNYLAFRFRIRKEHNVYDNKINYKPPWQDFSLNKNNEIENLHVNGNSKGLEEEKEVAGYESDSTAALMEKNLKVMTDKMKEEENEKRIKHEFDVCAKTIDIFAMIVFVIMFFLITIVYLIFTM